MAAKLYRRCMICDRRVDLNTGSCPTPEACARFKHPHARPATEDRAIRNQAKAARVASERIGIDVGEIGPTPGPRWKETA